MSEPDLRDELSKIEAEPLLPIEKKLIGWSLGIGVALLTILAIVNHFFPLRLNRSGCDFAEGAPHNYWSEASHAPLVGAMLRSAPQMDTKCLLSGATQNS